MSSADLDEQVLRSEFDLNFNYTRTYGPVLGRFFAALKNKKLLGIKAKDGRVLCPPQEYDPQTAEALADWVELGEEATLASWCWVQEPLEKHPLNEPFAWALLKIDGADSCMVHAVSIDDPERLAAGLRLRPVWADERHGQIRDIVCFTPCE